MAQTHDWALALEDAALPPDLPPVIVKVEMGEFEEWVWGFDGVMVDN